MAKVRRYLNRLNGWEQVGTAAAANAAELPHLEMPRTKLSGLLDEARNLYVQQTTLVAQKQEVSKRLRKVIRQGEALADFLRTGAREHFGNDSEKRHPGTAGAGFPHLDPRIRSTPSSFGSPGA